MSTWTLDDEHRLDVLAEVDVFPGIPDAAFDCYTRLVARMLDAPVALVSFVTDDRQFFPSAIGLADPWSARGETPLSMSFCQHVVIGNDILRVSDAPTDPRVADNDAITVLGVQAYLGMPMLGPDGEPLGSVCAIDNKPRDWSDEDVAILRDIAEAVSAMIALRVSEHRRARYARQASHELRTPLAALRLELEDLQVMSQGAPHAEASLGAAVAQVDALSGAVDGLVVAAHTDGRLVDSDVDVAAILRELVAYAMTTGTIAPDAVAIDAVGSHTVHAAPALLHHVLKGLVDAASYDGSDVRVAIDTQGLLCRVQMHTACKHDPKRVVADVFLHELGARLLVCPREGVAFELLLPV